MLYILWDWLYFIGNQVVQWSGRSALNDLDQKPQILDKHCIWFDNNFDLNSLKGASSIHYNYPGFRRRNPSRTTECSIQTSFFFRIGHTYVRSKYNPPCSGVIMLLSLFRFHCSWDGAVHSVLAVFWQNKIALKSS